MSPKYIHHLLAVRWTAPGGADYFGGFAEISRPHDRRRYEGELLRVLAAEIIEAVYGAARNAKRLSWPNLDGRAVNRPCEDAFDTIDNLLVSVILVGRRSQLLPNWDAKLKNGRAPLRISACNKKPDAYRANADGFF